MSLPAALALLSANPIFALVLLVGTYGWWRLISKDSLFEELRDAFYRSWPHEGFSSPESQRPRRGDTIFSGGSWYTRKGTKLGDLVYCPWCLSWWIGIVQFLAFLVWPYPVLAIAFLQTCRVASGLLGSNG